MTNWYRSRIAASINRLSIEAAKPTPSLNRLVWEAAQIVELSERSAMTPEARRALTMVKRGINR